MHSNAAKSKLLYWNSSTLLTALSVYFKHLFSKHSVKFLTAYIIQSGLLLRFDPSVLVACVKHGVPSMWEMLQVAGNLWKNLLLLSLTTRCPPVVSITVYLPHTEVLFNLTRTFFSQYLLFRDFWEETKGFQSETPWSGSWLSESQCGHCFRTIAAQASQECVHEIIRWERSFVEAFRFGTLKDGPQTVFPVKARSLLCVGMALRVCVCVLWGGGGWTDDLGVALHIDHCHAPCLSISQSWLYCILLEEEGQRLDPCSFLVI